MPSAKFQNKWKSSLMILFTLLLLVTFSSGQAAAAQPAQQAAATQAAHYIVFERGPDGSVRPVYYRAVELAQPLDSLSEKQISAALAGPTRNADLLQVTLRAQDEQIVYRGVVQVSPWLRGEFSPNDPAKGIDGHFIPLDSSYFVVRVPLIDATTLTLSGPGLQSEARFDMQRLAQETEQIELDPAAQSRMIEPDAVSSANRVDFLVMGDGYTSAQQAKFNTDSAATTTAFFSISPYSVYKNYFKLTSLFTASTQAGADHPPYNASCGSSDPTCCADPFMETDPLEGQMVNTAFDSRYCAYAIHRLLVPNTLKVYTAAAAAPDWDSILLLVNDSTYGGSGGYFATVSMHVYAPEIAQHEYGHSFVDLADEYDSPYPGYPACSDKSGTSPCESNVTDVTDPALIKWKPWIKNTTPIPTPNEVLYDGLVGLFEGARYQTNDVYRPGYNCIMRALGVPFCQVPSQSFVLRLYKGGWGVPADGISLIEPGSQVPLSPTVKLIHPASKTFSITTLSPVGGPASKISWYKDGVLIPGATGKTYTYNTVQGGPASVKILAQVKDVTTLVNPTMGGTDTQSQFTWTVSVDYSYLSISGNTGAGGVTLSYIDGTAKTVLSNSSGAYAIPLKAGWSGTITPSKKGMSFLPANRTYTNLSSSQTGQNFAAKVSISGSTGLAGVNLKYIDGTAKTATSDTNGKYSFKVPYNWSGTVTPVKVGVPSFTPKSRTYTALKANVAAQNYLPNQVGNYTSIAAQDGYLTESTETSGVGGAVNSTAGFVLIGDDALNKQYRALLSFDTSLLPDNAVIVSARLKLKQKSLTGSSPFGTHGLLTLAIRRPYFGTDILLKVADFAAAAGLSPAGSVGAAPVGGYHLANLPAAAFAHINRTGSTQIRLAFALDDNNDLGADYLSFFSGETAKATDRPTLIITYHLP